MFLSKTNVQLNHLKIYRRLSDLYPIKHSSIEHGGTRPFSNIMAPLTLFNEAPKRKSVAVLTLKSAYLWLNWSTLMRGYQDIFSIVGTIEWQANERSEGASRATERSEGASRATERLSD